MQRWCAVFVVVGVLASGVVQAGQDRNNTGATPTAGVGDRWAPVTRLPVGTRLRVLLVDGREVEGLLTRAFDDRLAMRSIRSIDEWARASVARLDRQERRTRAGALVGAAVGAGVGAVIASLAVRSARDVWIPSMSAGWAGLGVWVGVVEGSGRVRFVTVYRGP